TIAAAQPPRPQMSATAMPTTPGWWRRWWSNGASFGLGAACAAALAFLLVLPALPPDVTEQIVAGHVRALQPGHLQDVASDDRHTVKPWFDGRIDFAPAVKAPAAHGVPLADCRL